MTIRENERELSRRARTASYRRELTEAAAAEPETVVLRLCTVTDDSALDRLALLEGQPQPLGRHVVAEVDGAIVAALPLMGGPAIADPFQPTAQIVPLLELRRKQLGPDQPSPFARLTARARAATRVQPAR